MNKERSLETGNMAVTSTTDRKISESSIQRRSQIPLIRSVTYDESALLGPVNLKKVITLLKDPYSRELYQRHARSLQKIVRDYKDGFLLKDLLEVVNILNICCDRFEENDVYKKPLQQILSVCGLPFLKEKTSDEIAHEDLAMMAFCQIGYLMRVPCLEARKQICINLLNLYTDDNPNSNLVKYQPCSKEYLVKLIDLSDMMLTIVKCYQLEDGSNQNYKLLLLKVLQKYSHHSAPCCDQMLEGNLPYTLCSQITPNDTGGHPLLRTVEILWNILDKADDVDLCIVQLSHLECINKLKDTFVCLLKEGYTHAERQLRNDILFIISLIASRNPNAPFIETGFLRQLVAFAIHPEVKTLSPFAKDIKLTKCYEDFEMKKLLYCILCSLSQESASLPLLCCGHLLRGLFFYIHNIETDTSDMGWSPSEYEEMQLHVLSCMCIVCPLLLDSFMAYSGTTRILLLLEWCITKSNFKGHGNSYLGEGSRGTKVAQTRLCLRLIFNMIATREKEILREFVDQGIINLIVSMLALSLMEIGPSITITNEMKSTILLIISILCETDVHRKELLGTNGLDILMCFLRCDLSVLSSGLGYHILILATIDCVWCAVVGSSLLENHFLENEGCFLLLDLLEILPHNMRSTILSFLVDLCHTNQKTIRHILIWRGSRHSITAPHLFCRIWQEEEKEMEVIKDSMGLISAVKNPLAGLTQREQGIVLQPAFCASPAIVDVTENMRAKIYCLFTKLGFSNLPGLTILDHVTLILIENYMDFKTGEVWVEVIEELEKENVAMIEHDQQICNAILARCHSWGQITRNAQLELMASYEKTEALDEQECYAEMRKNYEQKEMEDNLWVQFVSRTSQYSLLQAAKRRQCLSIESSRIQTDYLNSQYFHSIDIPNLGTTVFSNIQVDIQSTPKMESH
ncbi:ciliaflagella69-likeassociated and flagella-associated 69-like [Octopus vulgaris]|uniref:Ciliaflagella69-likeassociated and flagella-associated 69-like n=1 Tax=Octopus vulgaris TaxID=6645 RepID=A0AA36BMP6_OCTVU|nr:ciliaflagella69-likeassociated and flagella-associated 69-like [Octopus vulgaris]